MLCEKTLDCAERIESSILLLLLFGVAVKLSEPFHIINKVLYFCHSIGMKMSLIILHCCDIICEALNRSSRNGVLSYGVMQSLLILNLS